MTSSPLRVGATLSDELEYYKKQYEQLETDLADFQASSKDLEEQLERDIETAEKRERKLKEQVEKLGFEVEEWKSKHKQAKAEANAAQNALQREVTGLREAQRALQMKLRDIEVVNDDFERQARHTESSLEDLESKYNVAIERDVLLEEEIKAGEQEREALRIETQRLRDELGDLKVESEITLEKLRLADGTIERLRLRKPSPPAVEYLRARSPVSEASGVTPSSPTASTPPPKSDSLSDAPTPPSPAISDTAARIKFEPRTPLTVPRRSLMPESATPRPSLYGPRTAAPKHSRDASTASSAASDTKAMRPPAPRPRQVSSRPSIAASEGLPRSDSLYQIKALRGRMQKIEERVHSARSKLPASNLNSNGNSVKINSPLGSPRPSSALSGEARVPASVTIRRSIRRPAGSLAGSSTVGSTFDDAASAYSSSSRRETQLRRPPTPAGLHQDDRNAMSATPGRRESTHVRRLSYGLPVPSPRPPSSASERLASVFDPPPSDSSSSRPGSRASMASNSGAPLRRPESRGANRPSARPSSSLAGPGYATVHGLGTGNVNATRRARHRPSASVAELRARATGTSEDSMPTTPRGKAGSHVASTTITTALPRRQSAGIGIGAGGKAIGRRTSVGLGPLGENEGGMKPPPAPHGPSRKMSDVGETY